MSIIVNVLADIIHLMQIIVMCDTFFVFKRRESRNSKLFIMIAGFIMGIVSLIINVYDNHFIETAIYIVTIILLIYMLYREKLRSAIIVSAWMIFALSMLYAMSTVLFDMFLDMFNINGDIIYKLGISIISLILVYAVGQVYKKHTTEGMTSIGAVNLFWFTLLLVVDTLVVTIIAFMNVNILLEKYKILFQIAVILVIIGIFIQLAAVIFLFMQRNVYKEKKQLTEKYLNEQKNYYEYLENRETETKKFRHDLRNHMELISSLVTSHDYEKIDSYLEQMQIKVEKLGNIVTVQNGTVDAIINQYYAKAQQQGIKMEVKGRFPQDCRIDIYDICTIFSNVLSNALEAAVQTQEKYISVECRYTDRNIIIVVKNSFNSDQPGGNVQLKTRKENVDYHGFGLENMKDSINKYKGVFDIETKDNIFKLTILFNNMGM